MDVKIETPDKKIVASGSFIIFTDSKTVLSFKYEEEFFKFEFNFKKEDSNNSRIDFHANDEKDMLIMDFYNFNVDSDIDLVNPVIVSENRETNKKMYFQASISSIKDNFRKINYTFYVDK